MRRLILLSDIGCDACSSLYGAFSRAGEAVFLGHCLRHQARALILRLAKCQPWWDELEYSNIFGAYASTMWRGGISSVDAADAVLRATNYVHDNLIFEAEGCAHPPPLNIAPRWEYTSDDLESWDKGGPGSSLEAVYGQKIASDAEKFGLDVTFMPILFDTKPAEGLLGWKAKDDVRSIIDTMRETGRRGPPPPTWGRQQVHSQFENVDSIVVSCMLK